MKDTYFDTIILGAGPAGCAAALKLATGAQSVLLVETNKIGGVCLNEGCIPAKIFLKHSNLYHAIKESQRSGIIESSCSYSHEAAIKRKNEKIAALRNNLETELSSAGVTTVYGFGEIIGKTGRGEIEVAVAGQHYMGGNLIVATGSRNAPTPTFLSGYAKPVITSSDIFDVADVPKELLIIGAGAVGLEIADYFSSIGTRVTVLEKTAKLGLKIDKDISEMYQKSLQRKGIKLLLETEVTESGSDYIICRKNEEQIRLEPDLVFLSIGRRQSADNIGLDRLGIKIGENGIITDDFCQTADAAVFACGDVNGKSLYAHTAMREGETVASSIMGKRTELDYSRIPAIVYGSTEYAQLGKTEEELRQTSIPCKAFGKSLLYNGRYFAENEKDYSYCKLIIQSDSGCLLGVQMLGVAVAEILLALQVMLDNEMSVHQINEIIFAHPTVGEIIKDICSL
ncbi:MAG: FAD-dependent oxidoreductase [Lachnospiraceae bacterium]|jgi:dihydrolipoamide dehydrogenase|nr:FAD-dependent oxidoreductase [Lachnospiraceae bacterium]